MDTGQQFAQIAVNTMDDHGFDQRANRVAKVRDVSSMGSQEAVKKSYANTGFRRC